jgi:hypothetical protein
MEIALLQKPVMNGHPLYPLKKALYAGLLIPLIYCSWMAIVMARHPMLIDWDGVMHYFAGADIYHGNGYRGWASHFWPPLYPLLTGTLLRWMDGALAAKLISLLSATLLLWLSHRFAYKLSGNAVIACLAQLVIATDPDFVVLSIKAENHMLDSLFYVMAIWMLLQNLEKEQGRGYWMVGLVCGLAGLSRYTSYSLLPAFVGSMFCFYPPRRATLNALRITAGFVLISSPWWLINFLDNGSPLATWQYMNIGAGVFTDQQNIWWWWWSGIDGFASITDIIRHSPGPFAANFLKNILKSFFIIFYKGQFTGMICCIAVFLLILAYRFRYRAPLLRTRLYLPVLFSLLCFVALVSQAFVFSEVFLSWLVLVAIYGINAIYRLSKGVHWNNPAYRPLALSLITVVFAFDFFHTTRQLNNYWVNSTGLEDNTAMVTALKTIDRQLDKKVIMSFHPGRAYYLGSGYVMLPPYYNGDLNGLVTYQHMSDKVKEHAPRYPSILNVHNLKVDYLIYDQRAAACLPRFSFLLKQQSDSIPVNFQRVYHSDKMAVYKIN